MRSLISHGVITHVTYAVSKQDGPYYALSSSPANVRNSFMAETTYVVGAGINRGIKGPDGFRVPLSRDFFRQALRLDRLSTELAQNQLGPLFDFIRKYWHLKKEDLKNKDFDLEECFTLIDLQRREAETSDDQEERARTLRIEFILTQLPMDYLCECEHRLFESAEFQDFGRRIFNERAAILTFNYDTLLETAIERASSPWNPPLHLRACHPPDGVVRDEDIAYSPHEWNSYDAYGGASTRWHFGCQGTFAWLRGHDTTMTQCIKINTHRF